MKWRICRRGGRKKGEDESAPDQSGADAHVVRAWPASAGAKEILGLQQLVGNQAVLRLLAKDSSGAQVKAQGS